MLISLLIPAFLSGFLMFLAPCTLPMVPGYLGFISGVSLADIQNPKKTNEAKKRIFLNGILYVIGFSVVFITFGVVFSLGGVALGHYRPFLARVGGLFVLLSGLSVLGVQSRWLDKLSFPKISMKFRVRPGTKISSILFGVSFALGWTPCVGPILATILLLATASGTATQGAILLGVFSLGLAIPFLLIAATIGSASAFLTKRAVYIRLLETISGLSLVLIGLLLLTNNFGLLISKGFQWFQFLGYDRLLDYL